MTFTEITTAVQNRLNLTSATSSTRIGTTINDRYRRVMSAIGMSMTRRSTLHRTVTVGASTLSFTGAEKIINVVDRSTTPYRILKEVTIEELRRIQPYQNTFASNYAIIAYTATSVTIEFDCIPQDTFDLYADVEATITTLSGTDTPNFPEDFHDILVHGALADEYRKMEKVNLAQDSETLYERRLSDLRMWIAKSSYLDIYQGKTRGRILAGSSVAGAGGGSSGSVNGAASYTQTGLITFDRTGEAVGSKNPFAVASGSEKVANLDADLLDGSDWNTAGVLPDAGLGLTDVTTNDVTSAKHGLAPKSPADATKFMNGAATPTYAQVKDSDLSTSDVVTNNVSSTKHGFVPKSGADATTFLNGAATPAFAQVKGSDLSMTDVTTNDVSTTKHGFAPKAGADGTVLRNSGGTVGFGAVSLSTAAAVTGVLPTARGGTSVDIASAALPLGSGQITFPAVQNPSANANTLDDYEEGTFTPALASSGGGAATYTTQSGFYVKVGKLVQFSMRITLSGLGTLAAGNLTITGLPFTCENLTGNFGTADIPYFTGLVTSVSRFSGFVQTNNTTIELRYVAAAGGTAISQVTKGDIGAALDFLCTGTYRASA